MLIENIPYFDQERESYGKKLTIFLKKVIEGTDICLSIDNNKLILRKISTIRLISSNKSFKDLTNSSNNFKEIVVAGKSEVSSK